MRAQLYAEQLEALAGEYGELRNAYNTAVERSAVTELVVGSDRKVEVVVRSGSEVLQRIPTSFDANQELFVDYVVRRNRLMIRRLYDDDTPPASGLVVSPDFEPVDWTDPDLARGLTIYRGDLEPGRWVVTVSGSGALDLTRIPEDDPRALVFAPEVQDFRALEENVAERMARVSWRDLLATAWQAFRPERRTAEPSPH